MQGTEALASETARVLANGLQLRMLSASTPDEIDAAFASFAKQRPDAVLVGGDPFYMTRREEIVRLVARSGLPAVYPLREFTEAGGLISYGSSLMDQYRQAGIYTQQAGGRSHYRTSGTRVAFSATAKRS